MRMRTKPSLAAAMSTSAISRPASLISRTGARPTCTECPARYHGAILYHPARALCGSDRDRRNRHLLRANLSRTGRSRGRGDAGRRHARADCDDPGGLRLRSAAAGPVFYLARARGDGESRGLDPDGSAGRGASSPGARKHRHPRALCDHLQLHARIWHGRAGGELARSLARPRPERGCRDRRQHPQLLVRDHPRHRLLGRVELAAGDGHRPWRRRALGVGLRASEAPHPSGRRDLDDPDRRSRAHDPGGRAGDPKQRVRRGAARPRPAETTHHASCPPQRRADDSRRLGAAIRADARRLDPDRNNLRLARLRISSLPSHLQARPAGPPRDDRRHRAALRRHQPPRGSAAELARSAHPKGLRVRAEYWSSALGRLRADPLTVAFALLILAIFGSALLAPWIAPFDPSAGSALRRLAPIGTQGHWLGTDELGRDMLSRLLHGGRVSLTLGVLPVLLALLIGGTLGIAAGFIGGHTNALIMRTMDVFYAFPSVLLALSPEVVQAIIAGRLPRGIGMTGLADLPPSWNAQHAALGV